MGIGKKIASAAVGIATVATGSLNDNNIKDYVRSQKHSDTRSHPSVRRGK